MEYAEKFLWWQTGVIYQVYPRSFQDSNGDGIGDLQGIISRLDYLQWLGVKAVWVSPVNTSPMADFGYDIADYRDVDPIFGNLDDLKALLHEVNARDMKLIMDLVPNHTSDQHPWFKESRSSKDNPKRDWYIWHDAKNGAPPNNWLAAFGGCGWEWDEQTEQYYFHSFLKEQPDLNWRNPDVRQAMYDVMRYWLDLGVDGFRIDVLWHLIKDKQLRDNPPNPGYLPHMGTYEQLLPVYSTDQPEVHDIVHEMRGVVNEYDERMIIGEVYLPLHKLMVYYGSDNNGAHLPFNFQLIFLPWNAMAIAAAIDEYEGILPGNAWPNWVLGNHDQPRIYSKVGLAQAKIAAMLLLTLRGTPTIYYGDEIGMQGVPISPAQIRDPNGLNMPDKNLSRDPSRTPMQWDDSPNAGFTEKEPWLPISRYYRQTNVAAQMEDRYSLLFLHHRLIALRQKELSLMAGAYKLIYTDQEILAYTRSFQNEPAFLIILNLSHKPVYFAKKHISFSGTIEIAAFPDLEGQEIANEVSLYGDDGLVIRLKHLQH